MEKASFARINWKSLGNIRKVKPSHWTWNPASKKSSGVRFIPNPTTKENTLVRVKLSAGRKAKLFRAPKIKPVVAVIHSDRNTTKVADRACCTVHAFSNVAQVPFFTARLAIKLAGRRDNGSFSLAWADGVAGYKLTKVTRQETTLARFLAKHPIGRFYVEGRKHAFAVINGKVVDVEAHPMGSRTIVEAAWTISVNNRE